MKRTQIYLTDKEEEGILEIIKKNGGGTKAEHIRRAVDKYIDECKFPPFKISVGDNKFNYTECRLKFKDSNDKEYSCNINEFRCTGIPYDFEEAKKLAKEYGPEYLGTVGYFRDKDGFLRDSGQIERFV